MSLHYSELAPPLIGCLICHNEGTITEVSPQRWWRVGLPVIRCSHCGAVARFDASNEQSWRIQYQRLNSAPHYHHAAYLFRDAKWINEDDALDYSRDAYIQRHRLQQVEAGNISWLSPITFDDLPTTFDTAEKTFLTIKDAKLKRRVEDDDATSPQVDFGLLIITDRRLHIVGQERTWVYEWNAIASTNFTGNVWTLDFTDTHFIEHQADEDQLDAQLFIAVINHLRQVR